MNRNKLGKDFWDKYFRLYDVLNKVHPYKELLNAVMGEMELHSGKLVADIGVGTGNLAALISKTGAEVVGLDISETGLEFFKKKVPESKAFKFDLRDGRIPLSDDSFDYVCCVNTLFAINPISRLSICKEFFRILKPGGKLVVTNLLVGYSPLKIYKKHIVNEIQRVGILSALILLMRLLYPTIMMFYYNKQMSRDNKKMGEIQYFRVNEQYHLLHDAGFSKISKGRLVFAQQAELTCAFKL